MITMFIRELVSESELKQKSSYHELKQKSSYHNYMVGRLVHRRRNTHRDWILKGILC